MKKEPQLRHFESKFMKFDSLMQFRVKHILLVASLYDSYVLEEDGHVTDLIYHEYLELNLTITPHVFRASNAAEALKIIEERDIDLVIIFKRVSEIDVASFGQQAKTLRPKMAVVHLAYDQRDLEALSTEKMAGVIDGCFMWTGDVRILLAIIKLLEDTANVRNDTALVGVRVIVLVEDSVRFYSSYLPLLYTEIMPQTRGLMAEGLNLTDRLLRMRARPKILLATTFEEAEKLVEQYSKYLLAIISDFRFPREKALDEEAGLKLVRKVHATIPDIPIIMQSSDRSNEQIAHDENVGFVYKHSPTLHQDLRAFILEHFGFGDFEFLLPDGTWIASASDFKSMEKCLEHVDENSLLHHAHRNHFSNWLMARTEFDLASRLRPKKVSEFHDTTSLRRYLIDTFKSFRHEKQLGLVSDFSRRRFDQQSDFVRLGAGSLGGKGRGLAFINALIHRYKLYNFFEGVTLTVPPTVILTTDIFDDFVSKNHLLEIGLSDLSDDEIAKKFTEGQLHRDVIADLEALLDVFDYPLAVRSSSLLEDSHVQPYAGVYETHMLLNNDARKEIRLRQLTTAIKVVFASTYFKNAKAYHDACGNRVEEEKMAVIIQQAVGRLHGTHFYPSFSGVGLSYNYYTTHDTRPEDGIVYAALGLGKTIVDGLNCLRFSPGEPGRLSQFPTTKDLLDHSQREFYAIDMMRPDFGSQMANDQNLARLPITQADKDGTLASVCSTYSAENDRIYDGVRADGVKVVTFAPILKSGVMPLAEIMSFLLKMGSEGLNCPVDIEVAANLSDDPSRPHQFNFLQIRPMAKDNDLATISVDDNDQSDLIVSSNRALGNISDQTIYDIIFVNPESFDRSETPRIAEEIGHLNETLKSEGRRYLLIGPGRWGSSERWLGIPVVWDQISHAAVIVEAGYGDFCPDPSFGTHFMQNLVSFRIGYLTVNENAGNGFIRWDRLHQETVTRNSHFVMHRRLTSPLTVQIDGRSGRAAVSL
ncbi:MAG: histidine kinase [candidate division Zixibacteria bacterium]|nr:histidine kinase [candidate division Zixibacteria bacterium]